MSVFRVASLAALAVTSACVSDSYGYAPQYPPGYDGGMGSGQYVQPGDLFGGQNVADVRVFYGPLAPYGQWVESQFGTGFRPNVDAAWRPYVNGRWGENRLWLSDDPWGWATDHYGRWGYDQRIGWVWVPGTDWAPSWVAWREDDRQQVAGWAPIPPGVAYSVGVGFGSALSYNAWNDWYAPSWVWVPRRNLYAPGFGGAVLPWRYGQNYWGNSHWNHNGGWNGRPPGYGYGRPPNGRPPGYNRPPGYGGNRSPNGNWAGNGNPGRPYPGQSGRPTGAGDAADAGQWVGRPGEGQTRPPSGQYRPPPQGNYAAPNGAWGNGGQRPPRNGYNNSNNNWQGRPPGNTVANAPPPQNWQRPDGGRPPGAAGAGGRPPAYAGAGSSSGNGNGGNRPQGAPPPQRAAYAAAPDAPPPVARPATPPRAERTPPPSRNSAESGNERPQ